MLVKPDIGSPISINCSSLREAADTLRKHVHEAMDRFALDDYEFHVISGESVGIKISPVTGAVILRHGEAEVAGRVRREEFKELQGGRIQPTEHVETTRKVSTVSAANTGLESLF